MRQFEQENDWITTKSPLWLGQKKKKLNMCHICPESAASFEGQGNLEEQRRELNEEGNDLLQPPF